LTLMLHMHAPQDTAQQLAATVKLLPQCCALLISPNALAACAAAQSVW
jgi:hypothetical protein